MPTYPTYSVNGTPLQDSAGRWHEHPETQILPVHSGLRSTAVELNALDGEYLVGRSPLEAQGVQRPAHSDVQELADALPGVQVAPHDRQWSCGTQAAPVLQPSADGTGPACCFDFY